MTWKNESHRHSLAAKGVATTSHPSITFSEHKSDRIVANTLMKIDGETWKDLGITCRSGVERNKEDYYYTLQRKMDEAGFSLTPGSLDHSIYRILEANNYHSLNEALENMKLYPSGSHW